jgi:hypothetical protein
MKSKAKQANLRYNFWTTHATGTYFRTSYLGNENCPQQKLIDLRKIYHLDVEMNPLYSTKYHPFGVTYKSMCIDPTLISWFLEGHFVV